MDGRLGFALLSWYAPATPATSDELTRKTGEWAAFSAEPHCWILGKTGQKNRCTVGLPFGAIPRVWEVHAVPGLDALAKTPLCPPNGGRAQTSTVG